MKLSTVELLLALLFIGCSVKKNKNTLKPNRLSNRSSGNPAATLSNKTLNDSSSAYKIKFEQRGTFGSTNDVIVGKIASFAVDDQNRVFIADQDKTTIEVFSPDGSYLTSLGRQGKGPAEFTAVTKKTIIKTHANKLYVPDYVNSSFFPTRLQVFSLNSLSFIHTIKLLADNKIDYSKVGRYYPNQIYPLNDDKFLVGYRRFPGDYRDSTSFIRYLVQDSNGNIISDPILEQKDRRNLIYLNKSGRYPFLVVSSFPFFTKSLFSVSADDFLYTARTDKFRINVYDTSGKYVRTFQHLLKKQKFNKSKLIDHYIKTDNKSDLGDGVAVKMIQNAKNLPDTWPVLHSMFFDDQNRLWVSTIVSNNKVYKWWVLKKSGQVMAKFKWSQKKPVKEVRNGYLYTKETNLKGLPHIVKYKIHFKKNE